MDRSIDFDFIGIAELFKRHSVEVPPNQREYSWGDDEVAELLLDLANAIKDGNEYFLGTIVLTKTQDGRLQIADGQQRLATVTMILAAIRDQFHAHDDQMVVQNIENSFLFGIDDRKKEILPKLTLNSTDNVFFRNAILNRAGTRESIRSAVPSNVLIRNAANQIREYFAGIEKEYGKNFQDKLLDWKDYLAGKARIIALAFDSRNNAFRMFETSNDRGLETSRVDLVKNYLFEKASDRVRDAETHWSSMRGAIGTIGETDVTTEYLRLACCLISGPTREKDILDRVQEHARGRTEAVRLLHLFDEMSVDYAAILNPEHSKWNAYDDSVGKALRAIHALGVTQIRPLLLAVARHFAPPQAAVAFQRLVSWSVRFQIAGGRGGKLDQGYAKLSNQIHIGEIKNVKQLRDAGEDFVPSNAKFKAAFEVASVTVSRLARYYLRCLETTARGQPDAELIPNDDLVITLEHIMPEKWTKILLPITEQDVETHCDRIGNLALLQAKKNVQADKSDFKTKKPIYKGSAFLLTNQLAQESNWGVKQIEGRQAVLAELAVKTWPIE